MERILHWILQLDEQIDREDRIAGNDLKQLKDQFQKHEVMPRSTSLHPASPPPSSRNS